MYKDSKIEVTSALYGTLGEQQDEGRKLVERKVIDVTEKIKDNLIANNNRGFNIRIDNGLGEDPYYGVEKNIEIHFTIDDKECIIVVDEGRNLKFLL